MELLCLSSVIHSENNCCILLQKLTADAVLLAPQVIFSLSSC